MKTAWPLSIAPLTQSQAPSAVAATTNKKTGLGRMAVCLLAAALSAFMTPS